MKERFQLLQFLCAVGRVASVVGIVVGLAVFFTQGARGGATSGILIAITSAGSFISFEAIFVLIAIEENTRETARLLRRQQRRPRAATQEDDSEEPAP